MINIVPSSICRKERMCVDDRNDSLFVINTIAQDVARDKALRPRLHHWLDRYSFSRSCRWLAGTPAHARQQSDAHDHDQSCFHGITSNFAYCTENRRAGQSKIRKAAA
jgi:hypothetical protein